VSVEKVIQHEPLLSVECLVKLLNMVYPKSGIQSSQSSESSEEMKSFYYFILSALLQQLKNVSNFFEENLDRKKISNNFNN
jgi:hypothetical protein